MPSTYSNSLRLELIGDGEQAGTWGQTTNTNLGSLIEQAITGYATINIPDTTYTLSISDGVSSAARSIALNISSTITLTATQNVIVPNGSRLYVIKNSTLGGRSIVVKTLSDAGITIANGATNIVLCTGTTVVEAYSYGVPSGVITLWSGSIASIPLGWFLCNGSNGTPDLRDRFIVGAGSTYAVGGTGGSANATLVSHAHTVTASGTSGAAGSHSHSVNDPSHAHSYQQAVSSGNQKPASGGTAPFDNSSTQSTTAATTGITIDGVGDHTHSLSVSGSTSTDGSSATNANLPPYYALAYIMKA